MFSDKCGSEHDPFTVPTPTGARSALSPTATSFTPGQVEAPKTGRGPIKTARGCISTDPVAKHQGEAVHGRVSSLQANSVPDLVTALVTHVAQAHTSHGAIGEPSPPHGLANALGQMSLGPTSVAQDNHYRFSTVCEGTFTSDEAAQRAIKITQTTVGSAKGALRHLQASFNVGTPPAFPLFPAYFEPDKGIPVLLRHSCSRADWPRVSLRSVLQHP